MIESWRSKYLPPYFGNQDIEPSNHRCSLNARSIAASSSSHQELAFRLTWLATKPPSPTQSSSIFTTLALRSILEDLRCRCFCSQSFAHMKPTICGCSLNASRHRSPLRFELSCQALASRLTRQTKQNPSPAHLASRFTTLRFVLSLQASTADFACLLFVRTMEPLFAFHGVVFARWLPTICGCSLDASRHRSQLRFELSRQALASRLTLLATKHPSPAHLASR